MRPDCAACASPPVEVKDGLERQRQLGASLGLPKSRLFGNTGAPNIAKLVAAYPPWGMNVTDIHALDDFRTCADSHISQKLKGSLVRPEYREVPVARNARERT